MKTETVGLIDNRTVRTIRFDPIGVDHELQKLITDLLHQVTMAGGTATLAQLGYLGKSSISYVEDHVEAKIFFDPRLACKNTAGFGGQRHLTVVDDFAVFQNILFVGDFHKAFTFDTLNLPRYRVEIDPMNLPALKAPKKKDSSKLEETEVAVLHANLSMMMAAAINVDMADPSFSVSCQTVGKADKKAKVVLEVGAHQEFPVEVTVTCSAGNEYLGYNPESAVPYLMTQLNVNQNRNANQAKLARKVSTKARHLNDEQLVKDAKGYFSFR